MAHTWQSTCLPYSTPDIPWRLTHLLHSLDYFENTATNTKFNNIFLHTRPVLFYSSIIFHSFGLFDYNTFICVYIYIYTRHSNETQKRGSTDLQNITRLSLWKAHLKYWSGTTTTPTPTRLPARSRCCQSRRKNRVLYLGTPWGTSWGLENSNLRGNFTGLRETFLFRLLEEEWICWAQEDPKQAEQLARTQRAPPQRRLISSPLALTLSHSGGYHHDTSAHWCL